MNQSSIEIRCSQEEDRPFLKKWLSDPKILRWFPMSNEKEIDDAINIWMEYAQKQATLTATCNQIPVGMVNLYLNSSPKLAHQALFGIIVDENFRGRGIGTQLIQELMKVAKNKFHIELLHLEVYEGNPAQSLYKRLGFKEFGVYKNFIKENGNYLAKIFMQQELV